MAEDDDALLSDLLKGEEPELTEDESDQLAVTPTPTPTQAALPGGAPTSAVAPPVRPTTTQPTIRTQADPTLDAYNLASYNLDHPKEELSMREFKNLEAFNKASDQANQQNALPYFFHQLSVSEELTEEKAALGFEKWLQGKFDPASQYADQNENQLQDGITKARSELDRLMAEDADGDRFTINKNRPQIFQLSSDIYALNEALKKRAVTPTGNVGPPEIGQQPAAGGFYMPGRQYGKPFLETLGDSFKADMAAREQLIGELSGTRAARIEPHWQQLWNFEDRITPQDPTYAGTLPGKIASAVGGAIPFIAAEVATGGIGGLPGAVAAFGTESALFGGSMFEDAFQEAKQAGMTDAKAYATGQLAAEYAPAQALAMRTVLGRFLSFTTPAKTVGQAFKNMAINFPKNFALVGGANVGQEVWGNLVAQMSGMDPNRKWNDIAWDNVITNTVGMSILGAASEFASPKLGSLSRLKPEDIDPYQSGRGPAPEAPGETPGGTQPGRPPEAPTVAPDVHAGTNASNIAEAPEDLEAQLEKARTPQPVGVVHDSAGNRISSESPSLTGELLEHERSAEARTAPDREPGAITRAPDGTVELSVAPGQVRVFDSEENALAAKAELFPQAEEAPTPEAPYGRHEDGTPFTADEWHMREHNMNEADVNAFGQLAQKLKENPNYQPNAEELRLLDNWMRSPGEAHGNLFAHAGVGGMEDRWAMEGLARKLLAAPPTEAKPTEAPPPREAAARVAVQPPTYGPPAPVTRRTMTQALKTLADRLGKRFDYLVANPRQLPLRYRAALKAQGIDYNNYEAFYDKTTGDFVVNPNAFVDEGQLADAVIRKFMTNSFGDHGILVPVDSWSQVANLPAVARRLAADPNMDRTTAGLYDPQSDISFINVPKHLASADPIGHALRTVMHEVVGHNGIQSLFGEDYEGYNAFLDRVWNGMQKGAGQQIASQFGLSMEDMAARTGHDLSTTLGKRRFAEELMARDSENYSPRDFEKLPPYLQKAIKFIRDGLEQYAGVKFSRADVLDTLREAWRGVEPERSPETRTAIIAKRILRSYEPITASTDRSNDPETQRLKEAARSINERGEDVRPSTGLPNSEADVRSSVDRIASESARSGNQYSRSKLAQRAPIVIRGQSYDIRFPRQSETATHAFIVTRPDGVDGPYGPAPSHPTPTGAAAATATGAAAREPTEPVPGATGSYSANRATADQYLDSLARANEHFDAGHELVGGSDDGSIITQVPMVRDGRLATQSEIRDFMAARGFHPLDDETYYNPHAGVIALEAHPGNVAIDGNGKVSAFGVRPFELDGPLKAEADKAITDAVTERMRGEPEVGAIKAQMDAMAPGTGLAPEVQRQVEAQMARDQAELTELRARADSGTITPEEQQRMDQIEYGPMLARDIEEEKGPGSEGKPPLELLKREIENDRRDHGPPKRAPTKHAIERALDPNELMLIRGWNAAKNNSDHDQISWEHGNRVAAKVLAQYGDDYGAIRDALVANQFNEDSQYGHIEGIIYTRLANVLRERADQAIREGDEATFHQMVRSRITMDSWLNEKKTVWGRQGSFWRMLRQERDGYLAGIQADYYNQVRKQLRSEPEHEQIVKDTRRAIDQGTQEAFNEPSVQKVVKAAQNEHDEIEAQKTKTRKPKAPVPEAGPAPEMAKARTAGQMVAAMRAKLKRSALARTEEGMGSLRELTEENERSMPQQYANMVTDQLKNQIARSNAPPAVQGAFRELVSNLQRQLSGKLREEGIIKPQEREKISAATSIQQALDNWDYLKKIHDQVIEGAVKDAKKNPDLQHALALFDQFSKAPFSEAEMGRYIKETGVDIRQLMLDHRTTRNDTVNRMRDTLVAKSNLNEEQARIVEKAFNDAITKRINAGIEKKLDGIVEQAARRAGKEPTAAQKALAKSQLRELVHIGALSDAQVADALGPLLGYHGFYPELERQLRPVVDELERYRRLNAPSTEMQILERDMERILANYSQQRGHELLLNFKKAQLINGISVHGMAPTQELLNLTVGQARLTYDVMRLAKDPSKLFPYVFDGWTALLRALPERTLPRAWMTLRYGIGEEGWTKEEAASTKFKSRGQPFFESPQFERYFPGFLQRLGVSQPEALGALRTAGKGFDAWGRNITRVVRTLHGMVQDTGQNATTWQLAVAESLRQGKSLEEGIDFANEMIYGSAAVKKAAVETLNRIGLQGSLDANGNFIGPARSKAAFHDILEREVPQDIHTIASYVGKQAQMASPPAGVIGAVTHGINFSLNKIPGSKNLFPIINTPANVANMWLESSPLGILLMNRRFAEAHVTTFGLNKEVLDNPQLRDHLVNMARARFAFGTALLPVVGLASWFWRNPDGSRVFKINGDGPSNSDEYKNWLDQGHHPYSIEFGNGMHLSYEFAPQFLGLAMLGNYFDALEYPAKKGQGPDPIGSIGYSLAHVPNALADHSFIRSFMDLSNLISMGKHQPLTFPDQMTKWVNGQITPYAPVIGSTGFKELYRAFKDDKVYQGVGWGAVLRDMPFIAPAVGNRPALNFLGEAVRYHSPLTHRFFIQDTGGEVFSWLGKNDLDVTNPNRARIMGKQMTDDQKYDYTIFRGNYIKQMLPAQMDRLSQLPPDRREKAWRVLEHEAGRRAIHDMLAGKQPPPVE